MEWARYNTELYSNQSPPLNNVKPSNFWGSHQRLWGLFHHHIPNTQVIPDAQHIVIPDPKHIVIPDSQHIVIPDPKSIVIPDSDRESKHITLLGKKGDPQQNCMIDSARAQVWKPPVGITFTQIPASFNNKMLHSSLNGTEFIDFNKIATFLLNDYKNIKSPPELRANA